jgi:hypothetical protein
MRLLTVGLVLSVLLIGASSSAAVVVYDPYASVDWAGDQRCLTQLHDHIQLLENRLQSYDDAGYCAVSFLHYSGVPGHSTAWKELHWPPEDWFDPAFLAGFNSIQLLIPDAEQIGWAHYTSPFLTTYLECYETADSPYSNPLCTQGGPKEPWHYSTEQELVDDIRAYGGLVNSAHRVSPRHVHTVGAHMVEICSAQAEHWALTCNNDRFCDGPANMQAFYDAELLLEPRTWAICVNDWHGPWSEYDPAWIVDSGKQIVLTPVVDLPTMKQRMTEGAMLAVQDRGMPKGAYPQVNRITATPQAIDIDATGYSEIYWIHNGAAVATGRLLVLGPLDPGTVRAEIENADGSIVFTQPWELGLSPLPRRTCRAGAGQALLLPGLVWLCGRRRP